MNTTKVILDELASEFDKILPKILSEFTDKRFDLTYEVSKNDEYQFHRITVPAKLIVIIKLETVPGSTYFYKNQSHIKILVDRRDIELIIYSGSTKMSLADPDSLDRVFELSKANSYECIRRAIRILEIQ